MQRTMAKVRLSGRANVAEVAAATGVIVSLIFVQSELRDSKQAAEAATREAISQPRNLVQ